jgi:hypothetical protein
MKDLLLPIVAVSVFIILVGFFIPRLQNGSIPTVPVTKEVKIGNTAITAEVADTETKRVKGLSGKTFIPENQGMLFIFDQKPVFPSIWMKDMLFPIDIIWITDSKIAKIDSNVPAPAKETPDDRLRLYYPNKPIDYVLEVNGGFTQKNNLKVGDSATF